MPKSEITSRQELREDIAALRTLVEQHRVEFRGIVRDELAPLTEYQRIANNRVAKIEDRVIHVETWQRDRSRIERAALWAFGVLVASGFTVWVGERLVEVWLP